MLDLTLDVVAIVLTLLVIHLVICTSTTEELFKNLAIGICLALCMKQIHRAITEPVLYQPQERTWEERDAFMKIQIEKLRKNFTKYVIPSKN